MQTLNEMPLFAAFHLGVHSLPKVLFTSIQNEKGYDKNYYCKSKTLQQKWRTLIEASSDPVAIS